MEAIKAYIERIKGIPVLKKEEEEELIQKVQNGDDDCRRQLISHNLKLVVNIAKHYRHFGLSLMDLIAEGNIGLMRSIDKYDLSRGFRFSTYAAWWIRQAISRALIDQGKTIRVPVYMSEIISKYKKTQEQLRQKLNREPSLAEVAKAMKLPITKISEIDLWAIKKSSLEAPVGEQGDSSLGDFIQAEGYSDTQSEIDRFFQHEQIMTLLNMLNEREKTVLDMRFGISDKGNSATLAVISDELGISRERVRQIEAAALKKLKQFAKEMLMDEVEG